MRARDTLSSNFKAHRTCAGCCMRVEGRLFIVASSQEDSGKSHFLLDDLANGSRCVSFHFDLKDRNCWPFALLYVAVLLRPNVNPLATFQVQDCSQLQPR